MSKWVLFPTARGQRLSTAAKDYIKEVLQPIYDQRVEKLTTSLEKKYDRYLLSVHAEHAAELAALKEVEA